MASWSQDTYTPGAGIEGSPQIGSFNAPDIDAEGRIRNRPVSNALQAFNIFRRFERQNLHRAVRNKQVADLYNGSPPYQQDKLNNAAQGWRSNWSRQAFSNTVDRVKPRFTKAIADQKYLTNSALPSTFPDAQQKSETFAEMITKTIRQWSGWMDFIDTVATEDLVFGYGAAVHLSQYDWRPRTFRQEDILFDDNCPTHASRCECFCVKVDYYIHELLDLLDQAERAEEMGYNIVNLIEAIRFAMPPRDSLVYNPRQLADMVRDGSMFYSRQKEARMIQTVHLFVLNYQGKIDHWWINRSRLGGHYDNQDDREPDRDTPGEEKPEAERNVGFGIELAYAEAFAHSMEDVITLFTFEPGNGRLHGSKGMGRKLYNVALGMDKLWNTLLDNVYLSSLLIGNFDSAKIAQLQPTIRSPFLIMPDGFQLAETPQMQINLQAFEYGMNQLQSLLDQVAGTFMPDQYQVVTGRHVTDTSATEAAIDAAREDEIKQAVLNRWWNHMQQCIEAMQRRLCSKENLQAAIEFKRQKDKAIAQDKILVPGEMIEVVEALEPKRTTSFQQEPDLMYADIEAVKMLVELMEQNMAPEEIFIIANQSATNFTTNVGAAEDQRIIQFTQAIEANPQFAAYFDQEKLARMASNAAIGPGRTDELFQPLPQQTTNVAASRQQMMEFASMLGGEAMPVDPRDPHDVHLQSLGQRMDKWFATILQMPPLSIPHEWLSAAKAMIDHEGQHIDMLLSQGATQKALKAQIDEFRRHESLLKQVGMALAKAEAVQQQAAQAQAAIGQNAAAAQAAGPGAPGGPNPAMSVPPGIFPPGQAGPLPAQIPNGAAIPALAAAATGAGTPPGYGLPQHMLPKHMLPKPRSVPEARALPPGTHFVDPSGKRRVRP